MAEERDADKASKDEEPKAVRPEVRRSALSFILLSYVLTAVLVAVFVIAAVGRWNVGVNTTYPMSQAIEWNWRARATNNLIDMASNLNRSLDLLGPFHGNPAWWFPKPDTDLDQIKLNIAESRDTALAVAATEPIGSFGYQQAVQNLQETIIEINDHLGIAKGWYVTTPAALALALSYLVLTFASPLAAFAAHVRYKKVGWGAGGLFFLAWLVGTIAVGTLAAIMP